MSNGFGSEKVKVSLNEAELNKLIKKYKGLRKYMKSPLYQVKVMDGTETVVSELMDEYNQDPIDL
jgi:hypothetical protein